MKKIEEKIRKNPRKKVWLLSFSMYVLCIYCLTRYVAATSGPKDVILILDISASMDNFKRLKLAINAAKSVISTLTFADFGKFFTVNNFPWVSSSIFRFFFWSFIYMRFSWHRCVWINCSLSQDCWSICSLIFVRILRIFKIKITFCRVIW